ncbi:MAG: 50S ribosomal protein L24 [Holosporales bacterium]|jgi:large subunit ribosomal protein L24|nr:50S ribosomal protein L24 [Holosporales bacterium]
MTQLKCKIKKGDLVQVITGREKGRRGVVKRVLLDRAAVIVENINTVVRNAKPSYKHPQGSHEKEMALAVSNVSLIDPSTSKPAKVGYKAVEGKKVRYFRKSGNDV